MVSMRALSSFSRRSSVLTSSTIGFKRSRSAAIRLLRLEPSHGLPVHHPDGAHADRHCRDDGAEHVQLLAQQGFFLSWRTGSKLMRIIDRPSAAGPDPQPLRPWAHVVDVVNSEKLLGDIDPSKGIEQFNGEFEARREHLTQPFDPATPPLRYNFSIRLQHWPGRTREGRWISPPPPR